MAASSNGIGKPDDKDMLDFLSKVDQVGSLIKDMASGDPELEKTAYEQADKVLGNEGEKTSQVSELGFNKSIINKYTDEGIDNHPDKYGSNYAEASISPEEFMKRVEEDSADRRKKRAANECKANELKERGNKAFKNEDYEIAVKHYSNAIDLVNDNTVYYTNRAQAYIKWTKYELALEDCVTALKLNKKCIKAYVHQGRALQNMNRFDEATESFEKICKIDKKHKELVKGYINEVNERKLKFDKLQKVSVLSKSGDENSLKISNIVKKLRRENLAIKELIELISALRGLIVDDVYKTLFRTVGGFQVIFDNPSLSRIFKSTPDRQTVEENDEDNCIFETLELFSLACTDNGDNIAEILNPSFLSYIENFLRSSSKIKIRVSMLCLVHKITQLPKGRMFLLENDVKAQSILDGLMSLLSHGGETSIVAVGAINNLALCDNIDKVLLKGLRDNFVPFVVKMMEVLIECDQETPFSNSILKIMPTSVSAIGNLARDHDFRTGLGADQDIWNASAKLLALYSKSLNDKQKKNTVFSLLGLMMNLTSVSLTLDMAIAVKIHDSCIDLLENKFSTITERSSGLLNRLMSSCPQLTNHIIREGTYKTFISVLISENEKAKNYIIKCIALCTSASAEPINDLMKKQVIRCLVDMTKSNDENAAGNAALCIGNCTKNEKFSAVIASTDVMQNLLYLATNEKCQQKVKHNAAIAIGKLASTDSRHLEKLRQLHGLEMLHEVLQANKNDE